MEEESVPEELSASRNKQEEVTLPRRYRMAKLTSFLLFLGLFLVLAVILSQGQPQENRTKARTKLAAALRKRKPVAKAKAVVIADMSTVAPDSPETTTLPSLPELATEAAALSLSSIAPEGEISSSVSSSVSLSVSEVPTTQASTRAPRRTSPPRSGTVPAGCGECYQEDCHTPADSSCPNGLVLDSCSCCQVCAALEGNRCYNSSLNLPYNPEVGICGPHLDCLLRNDLDPNEPREALCECKDNRIVCGSDRVTYLSPCKLREAAHTKPGLVVVSWSPCVSAPIITTPVENATVAVGEDVSLSCEVKAYPAPILHWEFQGENENSTRILPFDDSGIVVVVRGGPEQVMTTSWIQIIGVSPKRQGKYICVAENTQGSVRFSSEVRVYKSPDDE